MSDEWVDPFWIVESPFPEMGREMICPYCGEGVLFIRGYMHLLKPKSPMPTRCDVHTKCPNCASLNAFGVKMPAEYFQGDGMQFNMRKEPLTWPKQPVDPIPVEERPETE